MAMVGVVDTLEEAYNQMVVSLVASACAWGLCFRVSPYEGIPECNILLCAKSDCHLVSLLCGMWATRMPMKMIAQFSRDPVQLRVRCIVLQGRPCPYFLG